MKWNEIVVINEYYNINGIASIDQNRVPKYYLPKMKFQDNKALLFAIEKSGPSFSLFKKCLT